MARYIVYHYSTRDRDTNSYLVLSAYSIERQIGAGTNWAMLLDDKDVAQLLPLKYEQFEQGVSILRSADQLSCVDCHLNTRYSYYPLIVSGHTQQKPSMSTHQSRPTRLSCTPNARYSSRGSKHSTYALSHWRSSESRLPSHPRSRLT